MFKRKNNAGAVAHGEVPIDLVAEFLAMTAKPKWGWFNKPSLVIEGAEGTFGPRIERSESTSTPRKRHR